MQLNERLREIREKKSISQAEFAKIGDVSLRSQQQYEKGNVFPNADYLQRIAAAGYDAFYVLTGEQCGDMLDEESTALLEAYHRADAATAAAVRRVLGMEEKI